MDSLQKTFVCRYFKKAFYGLFGKWGSGKSSIFRIVKGRLESNQETTYKFIKYDAWKYIGNSFRRIFLLELQQQLRVKAFDKLFRFYDNINEDTEVKQITNNRYVYIIIVALFVITILFLLGIPCSGRVEIVIDDIHYHDNSDYHS